MVRVAMKTTTADSLLHRVAAGLTAVLLTGCLAVLAAGCRNGTSTGSDAQPHAVSASSQASPDGTAAETDGEAADSVNADTSAQHRQATERNASDGQSGQEQAVKLELYRRQPQDNEKFVVRDMLPGDSVSQFYAVKVYHDADVELLFTADITEQTKALADVLQLRVTDADSGRVLCEGTFSEIDGQAFARELAANEDEVSTAYYRIDAWLDTAVGNEYQAAMLKADFRWYVEDDGGLTPPPTGVAAQVGLWAAAGAAALTALLFVLLVVRRRKEARHEQAR